MVFYFFFNHLVWLITKNKISKNIFKETFRRLGYFFISLIWIVEPFFVEPWIHGWLFYCSNCLTKFLSFNLGAICLFGHYFLSSVGIVIGLSLAEYCRLYLLTGFPWATILPFCLILMLKMVSLIGPYGPACFYYLPVL